MTRLHSGEGTPVSASLQGARKEYRKYYPFVSDKVLSQCPHACLAVLNRGMTAPRKRVGSEGLTSQRGHALTCLRGVES